ncbi:dehydrogenase E1 component-domain-containing protein [Coprinopsis sp. MPI-PUGE-AT-0042]|nr:dehydrogenase E1 component-domain-containing protein [Coprinopsis sp. MPI-PUGE-AT-0042]
MSFPFLPKDGGTDAGIALEGHEIEAMKLLASENMAARGKQGSRCLAGQPLSLGTSVGDGGTNPNSPSTRSTTTSALAYRRHVTHVTLLHRSPPGEVVGLLPSPDCPRSPSSPSSQELKKLSCMIWVGWIRWNWVLGLQDFEDIQGDPEDEKDEYGDLCGAPIPDTSEVSAIELTYDDGHDAHTPMDGFSLHVASPQCSVEPTPSPSEVTFSFRLAARTLMHRAMQTMRKMEIAANRVGVSAREDVYFGDIRAWASNQRNLFEAYNMELTRLRVGQAVEPPVRLRLQGQQGRNGCSRLEEKYGYFVLRGDKMPGLQANGLDIIIAAKQAVQSARNWAVEQGNGHLIPKFVTYRYGGRSMSDPRATYPTHEEVQRMRSTQDPNRGLQKYLEKWGVASEQQFKAIDKEAKTVVDAAFERAKNSPEPTVKDLSNGTYYKGTEPDMMRGREREEFHRYSTSAAVRG